MVWRFIQGIAGAGGSVLSRSIARDKYQGVTLTQFFALLMTVNGLAPVLSPVLGGYIVSTFDWRTLFWVMAEISTVLLLGCVLFINETLPENKRGSSLLLTGRIVVQNRRFMRFCLIQSFMLAGLFAYIGSSSFVLQKEFGFSPMQFSLVFGLNGIGLIIASWIFSRLARRINAMTLLRGGLIAAILCALLTVLCAWTQLPIPALVALFFTIAFCSGIGTVGGAEAMSAVGDAGIWNGVCVDGDEHVCLRRYSRAIVGIWRRNTVKNESGNYGVLYTGIPGCSHQNRQSKVMNTSS